MKLFLLLSTLLTATGFAQEKAMLDLSLETPLINTKPGPEYDDEASAVEVTRGASSHRRWLSRGFQH